MQKILITIIIIIGCVAASNAQTTPNIVDHITASGRNRISQPDSLIKYLQRHETVEIEEETNLNKSSQKAAGYRVQIFSDNNTKTAKNEARAKSKSVGGLFPQYRTYVTFNSPYWRVRIGDFKTLKEAETARDEIAKSFPSIQKEIRVVKDRINVNN